MSTARTQREKNIAVVLFGALNATEKVILSSLLMAGNVLHPSEINP